MSFVDRAAQGDACGALKQATVYGALWAIGSSWSTAIRAIALQLFPHDDMEVVWAELAAAGMVTAIGLTLSLVVARAWCRPTDAAPSHPAVREEHLRRPRSRAAAAARRTPSL